MSRNKPVGLIRLGEQNGGEAGHFKSQEKGALFLQLERQNVNVIGKE